MSMNIRTQSGLTSVTIISFLIVFIEAADSSSDPIIVTREEWKAKPPTSIEDMANPVPYVIIHHSYTPPACHTLDECIVAMQQMQVYHQDHNGWVDIGYSYGAGGDGRIYEGRGWSRVGAHAPKYNNISIGICIIGDWMENLPPPEQIQAVQNLIAMGVREGKIVEDYRLIGHRQVRDTLCPGDRLFEDIQEWPHFYNLKNPKKWRQHKESEGKTVEEPVFIENNKLRRRSTEASYTK